MKPKIRITLENISDVNANNGLIALIEDFKALKSEGMDLELESDGIIIKDGIDIWLEEYKKLK